MFAVKGWSVDAAALKPQTEIFKSTTSAGGEQQKSSKKRKRGHGGEGAPGSSVPTDDIGRLWEKHVNGVDVSTNQQGKKSKKRKAAEDSGPKKELGIESRNADMQKDEGRGKSKNKKKSKDKQNLPATGSNSTEVGTLAKQERDTTNDRSANPKTSVPRPNNPEPRTAPPTAALTTMQSAMRQKLISARFRHLNETLYTEPSSKAQALFDQNPDMFDDYHAGFRQQVSIWPENPVDAFIATIRARGAIKPASHFKSKRDSAPEPNPTTKETPAQPLPRTHGTATIADLGCGDARLASTLTTSKETHTLNLKIHSFDLHNPSPYITRADIASLPLENDSVNVAILCLALMGTNWIAFVEEAYRVLHWKGELWVAEIKSRFGRGMSGGAGGAKKVVEHSVGSKRKAAAQRKALEGEMRDRQDRDEELVLRTEVDGAPAPGVPFAAGGDGGVGSGKDETDVSAFIQVLRRRGFVVKPPSEEHVDLRNKMFVKMEFVKALPATKGKNVGQSEGKVKGAGPVKSKFLGDDDADVDSGDEAKVLKPCLYKIR